MLNYQLLKRKVAFMLLKAKKKTEKELGDTFIEYT